ncbi:HAD family phosphatase [Actinomadura sp. ATCC 31491]|uniref:HAD family phosphatase n=1 Tax=Actinomadura luzonensis TaxID=2805427 RepID=A0ABT0FT49_9ACTN|nr:HAD family phosphatase [Actinomadura luzonensis]MCK2215343.1 HAD family phosphatase [Actinomadura luzonensis]
MTAAAGGAPLEAALFDMDGTLFDSEPLWDVSLADLAAMLGGRLSAETRRRVVGGNLRDTARIVQEDLGVEADVEESAAWLLERTRQLFALGVPWRPAARSVVESVRRQGIPTALVTSSHRVLVDEVLAQLDPGMFDTVVCGDEVTHPKPHPEAYLTAAERLRADPRNCVALEDSAKGIAAALAAGCLVVAVPEDGGALADGHGAVVVPLETVTVDRLASLLAARTG